MSCVILYKSKYGATERYAGMLAGALGCSASEIDRVDAAQLSAADSVGFAGGIYAGGISGMSRFLKLLPSLGGKRLCVLCVGASPYDESALAELRQRCKGLPADVPLFYARGAWDEEAMSLKDRTLCKLLQKMVAKQPEGACEPWMRELLGAMGQKRDWVSEDYLPPVLNYLKGTEK